MTFEKFLTFATHHSESIIQWVFLLIVALCGLLVARGLFAKKAAPKATTATGEASAASAPELKAALDKIMEQTAKLESLSLKDLSPAAMAQAEAQIAEMKKQLSERQGQAAQGQSPEAAKDLLRLTARVKELESKLSEYEILEDDIADLSLFKEENARLKAELQNLRGGAAPAPAAPAVDVKIPDTGDPMADFENTLKIEKQMQEAVQPAPVASGTAEAPAASGEAAASDDLFAEFTQGAPEPEPLPPDPEEAEAAAAATAASPAVASAGTPDNVAGALDTDKMMAEMAALASVQPSDGNALEESIDIEKMAQEANKTPDSA